MAKHFFSRMKFSVVVLCLFSFCYSGCASRMSLRDNAGRSIDPNEVAAKKTNKNLWLYTLGGGALSFGASFFVGSMIDRGVDSENRTALWVITGAGTVLGGALFAHTGSVRDYNQAVVAAMSANQNGIKGDIDEERKRRQGLTAERKKLEDERRRQELEREALLRQIREKQSKQKKEKN